MAKRNRNGGCILRFDDTITIFNFTQNGNWDRQVIRGVQWADHYDKENQAGKINVARYASITFPEGTFEGLQLTPASEETAIVYGEVLDEVTEEKGHRISDLLSKYQKSGRIKSVNDNSNREHLKNIKVVVA